MRRLRRHRPPRLGSARDYAFRLFGDFSGNVGFQTLIAGTSINGLQASYRFDGTYTDVSAAAVPEPETYALLLSGRCLLSGVARRKKDLASARP